MTAPKLVYFSSRGKAELIRMMLAAANVEYDTDYVGKYNREDQPAKFLQMRSNGELPFNCLPIFIDEGVTISQSKAIYSYIANKYGLYGSSLVEAAHIDAVLVAIQEILEVGMKPVIEAEDKAAAKIVFCTDPNAPFTKQMSFVDAFAATRGERPWLIGSKISIADISLFLGLEWLEDSSFDLQLERFPHIKASYEGVRKALAAYLANPDRFPKQIYF